MSSDSIFSNTIYYYTYNIVLPRYRNIVRTCWLWKFNNLFFLVWSGLGFTLLLIMFPLTLLSCTVIKMFGGKREEKYMRPYSSRNRSVSMHDIGQPAYKNAQNYPMRQFQNNNNVPGYYGNNQRSNKHWSLFRKSIH